MEESKRKGARTRKDVPGSILEQLNRGLIESANLTEWLCVDHIALLRNVLPPEYREICLENINALKFKSVLSVIKSIGKTLSGEIHKRGDRRLFDMLKTHRSDSVRCWAAWIVGHDATLAIRQKLEQIRPFAADLHFGVRELSWMAVREEMGGNLEMVIPVLEIWSRNDNPNIRRFASESTRPNGVWSKKIDKLKTNPEMALPILENLKSDPSKYVRDSVGNWLNDAGKTRPEFVAEICRKWEEESPTKETGYIVRRALRSLKKR